MKMLICGLCSSEFPQRFSIEGKIYNFQNRRFCPECSPVGGRNTKKLDVVSDGCANCAGCKNRQPLINFFYKTDGRPYSYCKKCYGQKTVKTQRRIKQMCVDYLGGQCEICGYDTCVAALQFHHIDPDQKEFSISAHKNCAFETVRAELSKCALLCSRCHIETHAGMHPEFLKPSPGGGA